ncbi:MAG: putative redox protein [Planctomycetota bacterium]|jgi:putative redox protein
MVKVAITYDGSLSFSATHGPSDSKLTTDAPVDNKGLGRTFSPTDLLVTSVGTCAGTLMAIYADNNDLDLTGMTVELEKHMQADPRRVGRIDVTVHVPIKLDERQRHAMEYAAEHCPVQMSLHPDVDVRMIFVYPA